MATRRFLLLSDVAEILNISAAQAYALVRRRELDAIKIGARGVWRVEEAELDRYIARCYDETRRWVAANPRGAPLGDEPGEDEYDGAGPTARD